MRAWMLLCVLLAGCTAPDDLTIPEPEPAAAIPAEVVEDQVLEEDAILLKATLTWNDVQSSFVAGIPLAWQTANPDCVDTSEAPDEFTTLPFELRHPVPNGTSALTIVLDWPDETYLRDDMLVAYKAPGARWVEGPYQKRTEVTTIPVDQDGDWSFAVCLATAADSYPTSTNYRPGHASGPMTVEVTALATTA